MNTAKVVLSLTYIALLALAIGVAGGQLAVYAGWVLLVLIIAHAVEVVLFFNRCRQAEGSTLWHLVQVFLFGVLHVRQLEPAAS